MTDFYTVNRAYDKNGHPLEPVMNDLVTERDPELCLSIGAAYKAGDELPFNPIAAANWFKKAALLGHASGAFLLAELLVSGLSDPHYGNTIDKDVAEGLRWFIYLDSITNDSLIKNLIALTYIEKLNDIKNGLLWLIKAAEQGHSGAAIKLGYMYGYGDGVEKDKAEAKRWFKSASDCGDAEGHFMYARLLVEKDYTNEEARLAYPLFVKAAKKWQPLALIFLAEACFHGIGVEKSALKAYAWYSLAIVHESMPEREMEHAVRSIRQLEDKLSLSEIESAKGAANKFFQSVQAAK